MPRSFHVLMTDLRLLVCEVCASVDELEKVLIVKLLHALHVWTYDCQYLLSRGWSLNSISLNPSLIRCVSTGRWCIHHNVTIVRKAAKADTVRSVRGHSILINKINNERDTNGANGNSGGAAPLRLRWAAQRTRISRDRLRRLINASHQAPRVSLPCA